MAQKAFNPYNGYEPFHPIHYLFGTILIKNLVKRTNIFIFIFLNSIFVDDKNLEMYKYIHNYKFNKVTLATMLIKYKLFRFYTNHMSGFK